jgi:formate hydrogenlyase subunit 6/NADH:ubiquinone oxidoreductase subunit I
LATDPDPTGRGPVVRPPGSVPEADFLRLCIRCGQCYQACPNNVLQPLGLDRGLDNLWTPRVVADWSGCEPSCSNCGQVCPTGAIRALPLEEKRVARMGLAVVDPQTCLPHAGREACQLCVDECHLAGYDALEFLRVGTELDVFGEPIEGSGFLAPTVRSERCVGCGLCQTRCYQINVKSKRLLTASAVVVEAGAGKEDRLRSGSYLEQRQAEKRMQEAAQRKLQKESEEVGHGYLPDFLKEASP